MSLLFLVKEIAPDATDVGLVSTRLIVISTILNPKTSTITDSKNTLNLQMFLLILFAPLCLAAHFERIDLPESEYPGTFHL